MRAWIVGGGGILNRLLTASETRSASTLLTIPPMTSPAFPDTASNLDRFPEHHSPVIDVVIGLFQAEPFLSRPEHSASLRSLHADAEE